MSSPAPSVLLVEDNPGDAELVRLRLQEGESHAEIDCVSRLADGLAHLGHKRPSVVLLDLNLPDSQGADTFCKVVEAAPGVPVVILSGQNDEALAIHALNYGVQDYINKKDLTSHGLSRAVRFAIHRQALLRSLDAARQQREEFKKQLLSDVSDELDPLLLRIQRYATNLLQGITGLLSPEQRDHLRTIIDCVEELKTILCKLRDASLSASERLRAEQQWLAAADLAGQSLATVLEQIHRQPLHTGGGEDRDLLFALCDPESFLNKI
jgi:DNA-binding NarL/FixJ family response regulator